jgi:hypothetical protein
MYVRATSFEFKEKKNSRIFGIHSFHAVTVFSAYLDITALKLA